MGEKKERASTLPVTNHFKPHFNHLLTVDTTLYCLDGPRKTAMYDNSAGITHQLTGIISVCGSCSTVFEDKRGACQLPWLQDIGLVCSRQVGNSLIWALFSAHPT